MQDLLAHFLSLVFFPFRPVEIIFAVCERVFSFGALVFQPAEMEHSTKMTSGSSQDCKKTSNEHLRSELPSLLLGLCSTSRVLDFWEAGTFALNDLLFLLFPMFPELCWSELKPKLGFPYETNSEKKRIWCCRFPRQELTYSDPGCEQTWCVSESTQHTFMSFFSLL